MAIKKEMAKWMLTEFVSSSGKTEQFASFARYLKRFLKEELDFAELLEFNVCHFYCFAFIKISGQIWYLNIGDVRNTKWFEKVLFRTAKSVKDSSGGGNGYTNILTLKETMLKYYKE